MDGEGTDRGCAGVIELESFVDECASSGEITFLQPCKYASRKLHESRSGSQDSNNSILRNNPAGFTSPAMSKNGFR